MMTKIAMVSAGSDDRDAFDALVQQIEALLGGSGLAHVYVVGDGSIASMSRRRIAMWDRFLMRISGVATPRPRLALARRAVAAGVRDRVSGNSRQPGSTAVVIAPGPRDSRADSRLIR
jgi:hypothetical protein